LGHIISEEGIAIDPEKIEDNRGWTTPKNVIEVKSFMGIAGYYRIFIEGFSKIVNPITYLPKKGVKFEWTYECEENFQHFNNILTSAPILKVVDLEEDSVVCIDACKEGVGGVLTQNGHVICYESRKLKENEINYAKHGLELETIAHALKIWRH
jgi:hypothetical protein